jgi:hypothetical protein
MLKKARLLTLPTPARQDAPFRRLGLSSAADLRFTFHTSRFTVPVSDARTPLADCFSILLKVAADYTDCACSTKGTFRHERLR